jgi:hypothetical protein
VITTQAETMDDSIKDQIKKYPNSYWYIIFNKKPAKLFFVDKKGQHIQPVQITNIPKFKESLASFIQNQETRQDILHLSLSYQEIKGLITTNGGHLPYLEPPVAIYNLTHREEIYTPLSDEKHGFYVNPSISACDKKLDNFGGFKKFYTVVCLGGSSIVAENNNGISYPLIKHPIKFYPGEIIESISFNPTATNPYEDMLFVELKKLSFLINKFSSPDFPKKLCIHLPWIDYILFGVELFIQGRINYKALADFIELIINKKNEYIQKIIEIFKPHNIQVEFASPFDNLLPELAENFNLEDILNVIFASLNLSTAETDPDTDHQLEKEEALVAYCLKKLCENNININQKEMWQKFSRIIDFTKIKNLEDLFRLANALMMAFSAKENKDFETCALLPSPEQQISISHDKLSKECLEKIHCDFLVCLIPPNSDELDKLPGKSRAAYILIENQSSLYYVDKLHNERIPIKIGFEQLAELKKTFDLKKVNEKAPKFLIEKLSDSQLQFITVVTGHSHKIHRGFTSEPLTPLTGIYTLTYLQSLYFSHREDYSMFYCPPKYHDKLAKMITARKLLELASKNALAFFKANLADDKDKNNFKSTIIEQILPFMVNGAK